MSAEVPGEVPGPAPGRPPGGAVLDERPGDRSRVRGVAGSVVTGLAVMLVWFGLTAPSRIGRLSPDAFLRIPLEALLLVVVVLVLPSRARRVTASLVGVVLGLLTVIKLLDMGFFEALGRPFDAMVDWRYVGSAWDFLDSSAGRPIAVVLLVGATLLTVGVLVLMPLAVLRLTRIASEHRVVSVRAVTAVGFVWLLSAVLGLRLAGGVPIASTSAAEYVYAQVSRIPAEIQDQREFVQAAADDPLREVPANRLLTGLRGKDVIFAFVESYGRVAVQDSAFSPAVDAVLDAGTRRLHAAGFSARSAFLTSPTFGGISWLAHSTLQSGLWVDNQQRYDALVASDRFTLSDAFKRAGWRTIGDVPAVTEDWPQATSFYHYDQLYDAHNVGYTGPEFGYSTMPDQYTLSAFQRLELADQDRPPVMAEIDLTSSHVPWAPLPHMVDWRRIRDGSVFDAMPADGQPVDVVWRDPRLIQAAYGQSIEYTLRSLVSFVQKYAADNLVLVLLGDHQPAAVVTGEHAAHDVPITVIAHDPTVMDQISGWRWRDGMNPGPEAPVWHMDAFRDRFLAAFGP